MWYFAGKMWGKKQGVSVSATLSTQIFTPTYWVKARRSRATQIL
jgi:hypothetical protein